MVHLRKANAGLGQAITNGLVRKTRPVLDAPKALFFGSGNHDAVANKAGGRVAVESVNTQNNCHSILNSFKFLL